MYISNLESVPGCELTCLRAQSENVDLWHRRLGHVSSSLLNKLVAKDVICGVPKLLFIFQVEEAGKYHKTPWIVSDKPMWTSQSPSRETKRYNFVIVDDTLDSLGLYSRETRIKFMKCWWSLPSKFKQN